MSLYLKTENFKNHDPKGPREPRRTTPRHILRAIRQRCTHMVCYEHAKAVHSTRAEPRSGPRQGAWYTFHKHWLATGVASMARKKEKGKGKKEKGKRKKEKGK